MVADFSQKQLHLAYSGHMHKVYTVISQLSAIAEIF